MTEEREDEGKNEKGEKDRCAKGNDNERKMKTRK